MAHRSKPGMAPLGHSPMGKESLEGPKKKHDDHGKDASRPEMSNKRAIPNGHWEMQYDPRVKKGGETTGGACWNPMKATKRTTMYIKVNENDH